MSGKVLQDKVFTFLTRHLTDVFHPKQLALIEST